MFKAVALQILAMAFLAITTIHAQISTPAPSPSARIEQTIGLTEVHVEYSRPAMRGRAIFGELVPYGQMWRTGANKNTVVTFSKDVNVGGTDVPAGSYALFTKPNVGQWEVYLYADTENWGTPREWDESKVAAKVMAPAMEIGAKSENFTILFDELKSDGGNMYIMWDDIAAVVPIGVGTDTEAMASIERVLQGPGANDYYAAATYYFDHGKDKQQAYTWIKKATEMNPDAYWMARRQSLIEADLGMKAEALASAKKSKTLAEKAGNMDYVRMNDASIKEWSM